MLTRDISLFQGTIARPMRFAGVGLHSGRMVELDISPMPANTGIVFQRTDTKREGIVANTKNIASTNLCTCIGSGDQQVSTIEHLMAAFAGLGIDNALVQINATEVPILDGSSAPFVDMVLEVGVQLLSEKRRLLRLEEGFEIREDDQYIRYEPNANVEDDNLEIHCTIDFKNSKAIGRQSFSADFSKSTFMSVCEARTFCHVNDVNKMRELGLALGGSLDNAIVVNDEGILNNEGLRFSDEFVRHKFLDLVGDLALLEGRIMGKISTYKSGHAMHAKFSQTFMQKFLAQNSRHSEPVPLKIQPKKPLVANLFARSIAK